MKAYLIRSASATFGQTDAGCHHVASAEEVVATVGLDAPDAEIAAFMAQADLRLVVTLGNQREPWGEMFPTIKIPLPHTREGLLAAIKVATKRRPGDPYIVPASWAQHRIHFGEAPELEGPSVHLDGGNLAYQRALLAPA